MAQTRKRNPANANSTRKKAKKPTKKTIEKDLFYQDEIIIIVTLVMTLLMVLSHFHLSGAVGEWFNNIEFGLFGWLAYVFPYLLFTGVAFGVSNKGNSIAKRKLICSCCLFITMSGILQMLTGISKDTGIFELYKNSSLGKNGGGLIGGLICKLFLPFFGTFGTYVMLAAILLVLFMFLTEKLIFSSLSKKGSKKMHELKQRREAYLEVQSEYEEFTEEDKPKQKRKAKTFVIEPGESEPEKKRKRHVKKKTKEAAFDMEEIIPEDKFDFSVQKESENVLDNSQKPLYELELEEKFGKIGKDYDIRKLADKVMTQDIQETKDTKSDNEDFPIIHSEPILAETELKEEIPEQEPEHSFISKETKKAPVMEALDESTLTTEVYIENQEIVMDSEDKPDVKIGEMPNHPIRPYEFPPLSLLTKPKRNAGGMSNTELKETAVKLQKTLESFGVKVSVNNVSCGPSVTRYEIQPEQGVKVSKITALSDDIKLNLAAADIRIEAPIPGKAAVGIEVPNKTNTMVYFRELLENNAFKEHDSNIAFAVGKDIGGQTVVTDIAKMPHLLIAGATGSGKSVCINTLIMSILYKATPDDVKLIMVDPKVVELSVYNGIPHLLIPVVTDPKKASAALNWAVMEMTDRYQKFAELGVRDMKGYNEKIKTVAEYQDERYQKMPQIVIIVDELADLMMVAPGEVEDAICRLAQMARAAGLHLVIATQRPSVNVITGLIKANVPSRIAFSVSSAIDSRTILDGAGAEKLLGKGDMLFFPSGIPKPVRVQGAFISDKEVSNVVEYLKEQSGSIVYNTEISEKISSAQSAEGGNAAAAKETDAYFTEAGKFIIEKEKASIGMLQRVYKIGFNRAARIMDQLYEAGVVGPEEGTKPRKVLMSLEEFEQYVEESV